MANEREIHDLKVAFDRLELEKDNSDKILQEKDSVIDDLKAKYRDLNDKHLKLILEVDNLVVKLKTCFNLTIDIDQNNNASDKLEMICNQVCSKYRKIRENFVDETKQLEIMQDCLVNWSEKMKE